MEDFEMKDLVSAFEKKYWFIPKKLVRLFSFVMTLQLTFR